MSTARRLLPLLLLLSPATAFSGTGIVGSGPAKIVLDGSRPGAVIALHGTVTGLRWTPAHGRPLTRTLPRPLPLEALRAVRAPAGDWVELSLILEDGLIVESSSTTRGLPMTELRLVLAEPIEAAGDQDLRILLPRSDAPDDPAALAAWLEDALLIEATPGDAND